MAIIQLTFEEILPIWQTELWPGRDSKIESNSAMTLERTYDMFNMSTKATFFAWEFHGKVVGVNSGHRCNDNMYRSRGLWVNSAYRRQGIGTLLLLATIKQALDEDCSLIWSYPKLSSWHTYRRAGFFLCSDWEQSELGSNAYCKIDFT